MPGPGSPARAFVALGSNLDDPVRQVRDAMSRLDDIDGTRILARSSLYRSAPFGPVEQPDFVNAAVALETLLEPHDLLAQLQALERAMGRKPSRRWGPRRIDLDLLLYGDTVIDDDKLTLPHPGIARRNFVLLPLGEIAPDLFIPRLGRLADIEVNASEPGISRIA